METNTTPKEGVWIMMEEPIEAPSLETADQTENENLTDWQEYFPDFSF